MPVTVEIADAIGATGDLSLTFAAVPAAVAARANGAMTTNMTVTSSTYGVKRFMPRIVKISTPRATL
jgi:hypothetical protein